MAPRPQHVEFPPKRDTPQARGQALAYWIQEHKWTQTSFSNTSGIPRQVLNRYLAGVYDLANMSQELVERLLNTMQISDVEAVKYFGIPDSALVRWRTFRPVPLGQGSGESVRASQQSVSLRDGLKGELTVSADVGGRLILNVDEAVTTGLIVTRHNGSLWVHQAEQGQRVPGEVLGGFLSIQGT